MKKLIGLILIMALALAWPPLFVFLSLGVPVFIFVSLKNSGAQKMTKAERRKKFNDDIMYY